MIARATVNPPTPESKMPIGLFESGWVDFGWVDSGLAEPLPEFGEDTREV